MCEPTRFTVWGKKVTQKRIASINGSLRIGSCGCGDSSAMRRANAQTVKPIGNGSVRETCPHCSGRAKRLLKKLEGSKTEGFQKLKGSKAEGLQKLKGSRRPNCPKEARHARQEHAALRASLRAMPKPSNKTKQWKRIPRFRSCYRTC